MIFHCKKTVGFFSKSDANTVKFGNMINPRRFEEALFELFLIHYLEDHSRIRKQLGCNPLKTGAINFGHLEGDTPQPPGIGGF